MLKILPPLSYSLQNEVHLLLRGGSGHWRLISSKDSVVRQIRI